MLGRFLRMPLGASTNTAESREMRDEVLAFASRLARDAGAGGVLDLGSQ
jgi:hypothetical protein